MLLRREGAGSIAIGACLVMAVSAQGQWVDGSYYQETDIFAADYGYSFVSSAAAGEPDHTQIISNVYGDGSGLDVGTAGLSLGMGSQTYTVGTLTLTRTLDLGNTLDLHGYAAGMADQIWQDGELKVRATAKHASFSGEFAYNQGGTSFNLFNVGGGQGTGVGQSATFTVDPLINGGEFTFEYDTSAHGTGGLFSSDQTAGAGYDNVGEDHMITYEVTDASGTYNGGRPVFLLFWEDWDTTHADWDYNDLVIELAVIPLPAPLAMGLIGLAGVGLLRRRLMKAHA